ncbi:AAA family ATPase [Rhodoferax sp.]|uniref:AAA family ATPase n=1 Tax=Rhodoferax sp. TaxID=50421 RepID=UPI00284914E4|nr:AAA family ATPase [Rhodoferax sp.]MDR3370890.1 ATP-binding protein [Rhodoferax sp.]
MSTHHHPRPTLAQGIADELMGKTSFSDAQNGLFLAGERRTGKTDFLRLDLQPLLQDLSVLTIYVDLMANKNQSPMTVVQQALQQVVHDNLGAIAKVAKSMGLEKIGVPGAFGIDLRSIGKTEGLSLHQVLDLLNKATKKPLTLIIDEAQHALTSDEGDALMWALKSARDQMKTSTGAQLMLVMSGSHTDKLTMLLNSPSAPFWGSQVRAMPKLGDDFVQAYVALLRRERPELATVRSSEMVQAFEHFGHRPQLFVEAIGRAAAASNDAQAFEAALLVESSRQTQVDRDRFTTTYLALTPLEQAVLERLIVESKAFRAFDAKALAFYAQRTAQAKVTAVQVQRAIDALRNNDEELVWKSLRGDYAVYDQGLIGWHAHLVTQHTWPPKSA